MKSKPLDELEMFDLLRAAYPERFTDDEDETWESAQSFVDDISGWDEIADLLGRVTMLTIPMVSPLTDTMHHCLGRVTVNNGNASMVAAVRRNVA